tara:strand:+ start:485 stop:931 length:447 start_codon:yes stop_codon:yes gene_type:complete
MERELGKIVLVSGGFDPIHSGHMFLIQEAAKYGEVVVLLNSDRWLRNKKGKEFLPFNEREIIMKSIKNVIDVLSFDDSDKTVLNGIKAAIKKYPNHTMFFANGGDRNSETTPEIDFCKSNNIKTLWEVGGSQKSNSSSWILNNWQQKK